MHHNDFQMIILLYQNPLIVKIIINLIIIIIATAEC